MNVNGLYWMNHSIKISQRGSQLNLRVGAVLVSEHHKLICSAFDGEECSASWSSILLNKVRKLKVFRAQSIYVTINTLTETHSFDLMELLTEVHINEIYFGLPDPTLVYYMDNDPAIVFDHVYRYPVELQREILEQNKKIFSNSKQSIKYSPYYSENRISNLVIENLKLQGFAISVDEINANKSKAALATLICNKYGIEYSEAISIAYHAISKAFNSKYGAYNYSDDTRSLGVEWRENFISFYKKSTSRQLPSLNILNVGVGSGHEAITLFSECTHITFVDIAQDGLDKIKEQIPLSKVILASAADLSSIPDNSYDLYVSLRTYNSSFFDIKEAISEAHRVLRPNSMIIISVANGFLCPERHCIIPGLIIPGTEFVDIYRGMDTNKLLYMEFEQAGFKNIQLFPTNTEIYLSAISA